MVSKNDRSLVEVGKAFEPAFMQAIRTQFCHVDHDPFNGPRIYFENCGGALTLRAAADAAHDVAKLPDNAGRDHPASQHMGEILQKTTTNVRTLLNAHDGTILSGESSTANVFRVMDAVITNLATPGGNLVTSELEHPCTYDATRYFAQQHGLAWRVAPLDRHTAAVPVEAVASLVDDKTIAVALIHASNLTGSRHDGAAFAAAIGQRGPQAMFLLDGTQQAPHALVDVQALGCDAYFIAGYKMGSTVGHAFAYLGPRLATMGHPKLHGKAAEAWDLGTRDPAGFAAFNAVVDYLCWLGQQTDGNGDVRMQIVSAMAAIEAHEVAQCHRLLHGRDGVPGLLDLPRVELYGARQATPDRDSVFAFNVRGVPAQQTVRALREQGIIVHHRPRDAYTTHTLAALDIDACVRASLAHYNTLDEVDSFLRALAKIK